MKGFAEPGKYSFIPQISPEEKLRSLVDRYNDFDFEPLTERTLNELRYLENEMALIVRDHPHLNEKVILKDYGV